MCSPSGLGASIVPRPDTATVPLVYQTTLTDSPDAIPDPSYMRSTLNAVPTTNSLLNKSKLPFGLVLTPYRSLKEGDVSSPTDLRHNLSQSTWVSLYSCFDTGSLGTCPRCQGYGHRPLPSMQVLHQPLRHIHRGWQPMEVSDVQPCQRCSSAL